MYINEMSTLICILLNFCKAKEYYMIYMNFDMAYRILIFFIVTFEYTKTLINMAVQWYVL